MGATGQQISLASTYRKVFSVHGGPGDSFSLTSGISGGTSVDWSATNMRLKHATWSVPGTTGCVSVMWENQGAGGTHAPCFNFSNSGSVDFSGREIKNTATNPTGNLLVSSSNNGGFYSLILEVTLPYNGIVH